MVSRVSWLLEIVPKLLSVITETNPVGIQKSLRLHKEVEVPLAQYRRVKATLLQTSISNSKEDYNRLPIYLERLKDVNKSEDDPEGIVQTLLLKMEFLSIYLLVHILQNRLLQ